MATSAVESGRQEQRRAGWSEWLYRVYNNEAFTAYLFILVPLLILFIIKVYPIFYNLYLSFTNYTLLDPPKIEGIENYIQVFTEKETLAAIRNTLLFTIEAVPIGTALALIIAKLLDQDIRGRLVLRTLYYLPVVSSVVVSGMIWRWIFNPQFGLLNSLIRTVGIPPQNWLNDPRIALPSLVIVTIWGSVGSNMVIFLAGLQDIPDELLEAAEIDGASKLQSFLYVTIPLMRPVILFVVVTFTIGIFRNFGLIYMLTQGGPLLTTNTLVWEVYMNVFGYLKLGKGAAISIVLLAIVFLITILSFRVLREREA